MPDTPSVFISHAREDLATAHALAGHLAAEGIDVSLDAAGLAGEDDQAGRVAPHTDAVIVLVSRHITGSTRVRREVEFADSTGTRLIPVRLGDTELPEWSSLWFVAPIDGRGLTPEEIAVVLSVRLTTPDAPSPPRAVRTVRRRWSPTAIALAAAGVGAVVALVIILVLVAGDVPTAPIFPTATSAPSGQDPTGAACAAARARDVPEDAVLRNCDLRDADFTGLRFIGVDLFGADLRGADLEGAHFYRSELGTDPGAADWRGVLMERPICAGAPCPGDPFAGAIVILDGACGSEEFAVGAGIALAALSSELS